MTELEEITEGKTLQQLFSDLKYQLGLGEALGGNLCSHFVDKIEAMGGKVYTSEQWSSLQHTSTWTTERDDLKDWDKSRHKYIGKRTILSNENGETVLNIEDSGFIIVDEKLPLPNIEANGCIECGGKLQYDVMNYWQCSVCGMPQ